MMHDFATHTAAHFAVSVIERWNPEQYQKLKEAWEKENGKLELLERNKNDT